VMSPRDNGLRPSLPRHTLVHWPHKWTRCRSTDTDYIDRDRGLIVAFRYFIDPGKRIHSCPHKALDCPHTRSVLAHDIYQEASAVPCRGMARLSLSPARARTHKGGRRRPHSCLTSSNATRDSSHSENRINIFCDRPLTRIR